MNRLINTSAQLTKIIVMYFESPPPQKKPKKPTKQTKPNVPPKKAKQEEKKEKSQQN